MTSTERRTRVISTATKETVLEPILHLVRRRTARIRSETVRVSRGIRKERFDVPLDLTRQTKA